MDSFSFFVPGEPITEGSTRAFTSGQRVVVTHDRGTELAAWRTRVKRAAQDAAREAGWEPRYDGPVVVDAVFMLRRPKSAKKRLMPHVKPDLDKLIRAVGDALAPYKQPGVLKDDSRIVTWNASKHYAIPYESGAFITVARVDEENLSATYDCAEWIEAEERAIQEEAS